MKLTIDDRYEVIPEWNGNRESDEPIKITCRYLTIPERARCIVKDVQVDGDKAVVTVKYKDRDLFDLSVLKIENLEVNGRKITNAIEFHSVSGLGGLFDEIVGEIIARNTRRELKN